jgi:hypothetical protein
MMEDRDRVGNLTFGHEGYDFLGEIERTPVVREDRRGPAHAPRRPVLAEMQERRGSQRRTGVAISTSRARIAATSASTKARRRERRIALQVHHQVDIAQGAQRRRAALGPVAAGVGRHHDFAPEPAHRLGDAIVIRRHHHPVDAADGQRRLPASLDQRLGAIGPPQDDERLAG